MLNTYRCSGARAAHCGSVNGLRPSAANTPTREFSGGERQRLAIARALVLEPDLLLLDESFSGLDASVAGLISNLLAESGRRRALTTILISHDLTLVARLAAAIAVMDAGRIVERGSAAQLTGGGHCRPIQLEGTIEKF